MDTAALVRIAIVISVMLIGVSLGLRYVVSEEGYLLHRPGLLVRSLVAMNIVIPLITVWLVTSFDLKTPVRVALVAWRSHPCHPSCLVSI
jgi:BASS family bile acid:Na+ symporter